ncbi:MAG: hypothetical protein ABI760_06300 [Ferruginibacter sp.]
MKKKPFCKSKIIIFLILITTGINGTISAQADTVHFSTVFNSNKPYRIFLPADYGRSQKRYPVIYYFHGNQGSHELAVDGIDQLVNDNGVILVAWNGRSIPADMRPYNAGYHGDNIADPGKTVMIYQDSHRTRLYYDDLWIDGEQLYDELQPDKWGDGYALSSLLHISKDCPPGHQIKFLACYEVKEWKTIKRNVTWGSFTITVGRAESK